MALAVASTVSCSLVYDGDVFLTKDAAAPPADAAPPPDVAVGALALTNLEPDVVFEGAGTGRGIPIVIHGSNIAPDAEISLAGAGLAGPVDAAIRSDGTLAAFAVTIPVRPALVDGDMETITVTVRQGPGREVEKSLPLTVRGLDNLVIVDAADGVTLDTATLRPRYARIDITGPLAFTGTAPARLVATAEVVVDAPIRVDGQDASGKTPGAPGPGGCGGGVPLGEAPCGPGRGLQGQGKGGGGGGGHRLAGDRGVGDGGGLGGDVSGNAKLVPLADAEAGTRGKGGGGGGGGSSLFNATGGAGGGGGGVIELTSLGSLQVTAGAMLSADGGNGGDSGADCITGESGGGGGGSGGAILVRAATSLVDEGTAVRVSVAGGSGGQGDSSCAAAGGGGGAGRVRIDFPGAPGPSDLPPLLGNTPGVFRGPVLAPDTPVVHREQMLPVRLIGAPNATYHVERLGAARQQAATTGTGEASLQVVLEPGINEVCAVVDDVVAINLPEGANCLPVAYIP